MTELATPNPVENVARGSLLTLLSIPVAMIAFALVGGVFGGVSGIAAIIVPYIAGGLYRTGAGAPLSRAGWAPFIGITSVAIILGTVTGIVATAWTAFNAVGGDNAFSNPAFWQAVQGRFTTNLGDNLVPILIGLAVGAAGLVGVLRGRSTAAGRGAASRRIAPQDVAAYTPNPYLADPTAPAVPPAPPAAPAAPTSNAPSPGVILNGKPLDPDTK